MAFNTIYNQTTPSFVSPDQTSSLNSTCSKQLLSGHLLFDVISPRTISPLKLIPPLIPLVSANSNSFFFFFFFHLPRPKFMQSSTSLSCSHTTANWSVNPMTSAFSIWPYLTTSTATSLRYHLLSLELLQKSVSLLTPCCIFPTQKVG